MKKVKFSGDISALSAGIAVIAPMLGFEVCESGEEIKVSKSSDGKLRVSSTEISYSEPIHFFRALGILAENAGKSFEICEEPKFDTNGLMIDLCQGNNTMKVSHIKNILSRMAIMGLNTFYAYMEDTYEVKEEPYFGYMRGRYTQDELREIDDFAYSLGITVIPCVQTLAHLADVLKWYPYYDFRDDHDTLMVGDERTYAFIKNILTVIRKSFRSKKIHVGMDEAWRLGQGNYLLKNGYRKKYDIMLEHLSRVLKICDELGIEAMIWSDMFMKAANQNEDPLSDYYKIEGEVPQQMIDTVPKNVDFVYWNYGNTSTETYSAHIDRHYKFTDRLVFAGAIWNWTSFTVDYDRTFTTTNAALSACKRAGLKNVFATTWGDGGAESNIYEILLGMQLYAEHGYSDDVNEEKLASRFFACTGCNYEDFRAMTYLDNAYGTELTDGYDYTNSSSWLMWQDIMLGLYDKHIEGYNMTAQYNEVYEKMCAAAKRNGEYSFVFEFLAKAADVLRLKAELGIRLKSAYDSGDKKALAVCVDEIKETSVRVEALYELNRKLWFEINKPFGWEVCDIRYGGLIKMLERAALRITDYLNGDIKELPELAAERLIFTGKEGPARNLAYPTQVTAGHMTVL